MHEWMDVISQVRKDLKPEHTTKFGELRKLVKATYQSTQFQVFTAVAILINFLCNAVEAEMLPAEGSDADKILQTFD